MNVGKKKIFFGLFILILTVTVLPGCRTQSALSVAYDEKTGSVTGDAVNAPGDGSGTLDLILEKDGKIIVSVKMKRGSFHVLAARSGEDPLIDEDFSGIQAVEFPAEAGTYIVTVGAEKTSTGTLSVEPVYRKE